MRSIEAKYNLTNDDLKELLGSDMNDKQRRQHQQTRDLFATFWGFYTDAPALFTELPARQHNLMKKEIKDIRAEGLGKLHKGHTLPTGRRG